MKSLPKTAIRKSESQYILRGNIGVYLEMVSKLTDQNMCQLLIICNEDEGPAHLKGKQEQEGRGRRAHDSS